MTAVLGSLAETSRCVAEKKYTEQQAKKVYPQVFVPVCNPDGTYNEVSLGREIGAGHWAWDIGGDRNALKVVCFLRFLCQLWFLKQLFYHKPCVPWK